MQLLKIFIVSVSILGLVNCAPKDLDSQTAQKIESPTTAEDNNNNNMGSDVELGDGSQDLSLPLITNPIPMPELEDNNGGGFLGGIFDSIGNLFGGNGCSLLSNLLGIGGTLLGGNPIFGAIGAKLPGLLFNCGGNSSLADLIPNGASDQELIFQFLGQILQNTEQGKNPFTLISQIKNPDDVTAMIGIVQKLMGQTGDPKLNELLTKFLQYQAYLNQDTVTDCGDMNPVACKVFHLVNQIREDHNLPPFAYDAGCADASQSHSQDMSIHQILTHLSSNGDTTSERLALFGVFSPWAENIVKGSSLDAEKAVDTWMKSPGHKKNILSELFTSTGIGYVNGYFTQCFTKN